MCGRNEPRACEDVPGPVPRSTAEGLRVRTGGDRLFSSARTNTAHRGTRGAPDALINEARAEAAGAAPRDAPPDGRKQPRSSTHEGARAPPQPCCSRTPRPRTGGALTRATLPNQPKNQQGHHTGYKVTN